MRIGPTLLPLSLSNENQRRGARKTERARRCVKTWNFGRFSECVSNVKGCRVFIGIRMRGWGGCLTFGPAHPLSPVTPPRGALRPVTSSRPRRRRSLNSVSFICLIKAPTFRQDFYLSSRNPVLQSCMTRCPKKILHTCLELEPKP